MTICYQAHLITWNICWQSLRYLSFFGLKKSVSSECISFNQDLPSGQNIASDLKRPGPQNVAFWKGNPLISGKSRLVKYDPRERGHTEIMPPFWLIRWPPRLIYGLHGVNFCHKLVIPVANFGKAAARKLKKEGTEKEALKIMNLQFFGRKWEVWSLINVWFFFIFFWCKTRGGLMPTT